MPRDPSRKNAAAPAKAGPAKAQPAKTTAAAPKKKGATPQQEMIVTRESVVAVMDGEDGLLTVYPEVNLPAGTPVKAEHNGKSLNTESYAEALQNGAEIKLVTRM